MANTIQEFIESLTGGRFALTFLDVANVDDAVEDELMIDKDDPYHNLYYKDKNGDIKRVGGDLLDLEDLAKLEELVANKHREANEYAEQLVSDYTSGGPLALFRYEYTVNVTVNNTKSIQIPLSTYTSRDFVMISSNTAIPSPKDSRLGYRISPTGLITFNTPVSTGDTIYIVVLKNIPVGPEGTVDAHILEDGTVSERKLSAEVADKLNSAASAIPVSNIAPTGPIKTGMMWFEVI